MTLQTNNAEGGTNGTTVTAGNSGGASGTAFDAVAHTGSTLTFDTAVAAHGSFSYKFGLATGTTCFVEWLPTAVGQIAVRFYVYFDTLPSIAIRVCDIRSTVGTVLRVQTDAGNHFQVQEGGTGTPINYTSPVFAAATWYRFDVVITNIANGSGAYSANQYAFDNAAPIGGVTSTTAQLGTTNVSAIAFGSFTGAAYTGNMHMDDLAINPGGTSPIGPVVVGGATSNWAINGVLWGT